jgi:hypothetical protein
MLLREASRRCPKKLLTESLSCLVTPQYATQFLRALVEVTDAAFRTKLLYYEMFLGKSRVLSLEVEDLGSHARKRPVPNRATARTPSGEAQPPSMQRTDKLDLVIILNFPFILPLANTSSFAVGYPRFLTLIRSEGSASHDASVASSTMYEQSAIMTTWQRRSKRLIEHNLARVS